MGIQLISFSLTGVYLVLLHLPRAEQHYSLVVPAPSLARLLHWLRAAAPRWLQTFTIPRPGKLQDTAPRAPQSPPHAAIIRMRRDLAQLASRPRAAAISATAVHLVGVHYRANGATSSPSSCRQRVAVNMENHQHRHRDHGGPGVARCRWPSPRGPLGHAARRRRDPRRPRGRSLASLRCPPRASAPSGTSPSTPTAPFWFPALRDARPRCHGPHDPARAKAAKCSALVLTLDLQVIGQRHRTSERTHRPPPPRQQPRQPRHQAAGTRHVGTRRRTIGNLVSPSRGQRQRRDYLDQQADSDPHLSPLRRRLESRSSGANILRAS